MLLAHVARVTLVAVASLLASVPGCELPEAPSGPADPPLEVGVQYHGLWSDWTEEDRRVVLDRMAEAGVRWIRMDVGWQTMEAGGPGRLSPWYLERMEDSVEAARARGIEVMVVYWATPAWANGGQDRRVGPDDPADYGRAVGRLAERFRGRVAAWEIWNEPNLDHFFAGARAADYVPLLTEAHRAIKAADPAATVVLGGPSYNDTDWLADVYRAGAKGAFDVLATHPYLGPADAPPETPDDGHPWTLAHVAAVRDLMVAEGDGDRPIWFTELGWSSHDNDASTLPWQRGVTADRQGEYLVRALELIRREHPYVTRVFWYTARDRTDSHVHENGYGLLTAGLAEKPAYRALRAYLSPGGPAGRDVAGAGVPSG